MTKLFNIDTRNWLIVGLILFIIILFFWKPCNKPDDRVAQLRAENAALKKEKTAADDSINSVRKQYQDAANEARGREQLALQEKQEADGKVKQQQRTIDRLVATIRTDHFPDTTNMIFVHRDYKAACDSLPNEIDKLNASLIEKDSAIDQWSAVLAYEIQLRDSVIEAEQKHSARINDLYDRQNKIVEAALKAAKPRGRLLGGVGLIGNETQVLGGTKINLAYQTKGGKQYQVGGILMRGAVWYEATVLITLIK